MTIQQQGDDLKVYVVTYPGVYLSAFSVVVASSPEEAIQMIYGDGTQMIYGDGSYLLEDIKIISKIDTLQKGVFEVWNGDY